MFSQRSFGPDGTVFNTVSITVPNMSNFQVLFALLFRILFYYCSEILKILFYYCW